MTPPPSPAKLSVILLTKNEEPNVEDAVRSLLAQEGVALEVVVVDSASTDATLDVVERLRSQSPERLVVVASPRDIPIGEARNLGLERARAPLVAFMSADATAAPGWARELASSLEGADVAYGRQEHAPSSLSVAAVVRGLRYHHFDDADGKPPETFASNVNAGIRREVFERLRYVDEGPASALDDVLFTEEAKRLGYRIAYNPRMLVRHKDATTLAGELRKNRREGYGWGLLAPSLGLNRVVIAWGAGLVIAASALAARPSWWTLALALLVLYAPALRRALRGGAAFARRAPAALAGAVAVSPAFDLAFLYHYLLGLKDRRPDLTGVVRPQGA